MTKKIVLLLTLVGLLSTVWVNQASATSGSRLSEQEIRVGNFSFKPNGRKLVAMGDIIDMSEAERRADALIPVPQALGYPTLRATGAISPGFTVEKTFNDDQYFPASPRTVDFRGTPAVHFIYSNVTSVALNSSFGYNVYNPLSGGSWPQGAEVGCELQTADADGRWVSMDVNGKGQIIIAGVDDAGQPLDHHFYYQSSAFSCFFGSGTIIPSAQYKVNFMDPTNQLHHPRIEFQEWAGDSITHIIAVEDSITSLGSNFGDLAGNSLNYFRKFGASVVGAWEGPFTIDSVNKSSGRQIVNVGSITASRVSPKVAVVYTHYHDSALARVQAGSHVTAQARYDNEIYMRTNDSIGESGSWKPIFNVTNYSRVVASQTAFIDCNSLYDSDDFLHIVWEAQLVVDTPYLDQSYFWGDFSQSVYHWSDRTGTISKVINGDFGIAVNTQVCGFPGPGKSYVSDAQVSECDGNLYITCNYNLDFLNLLGTTPGGQIDDCATDIERDFAANGEIVMVVSSSLDGLLWDAIRNITQSYTPDCDSALGVGGLCQNDVLPSLSRFGMDDAAMTASFGALTWPGSATIDLSPAQDYAGNHYLHLMFINDEFPGPAWRDLTATQTYNHTTFNPMKWVRLACVDPISAPQLFFAPAGTGYPNQTDHGVQANVTVTITNEGNTGLNVTTIGFVETSGPMGWLNVSTPFLSVPAGASNTGTFDVIINDGGIVDATGTIVALSGEVYMLSDAPFPRDSVSFFINNFIVGDVADQIFDTVSTGLISLSIGSNGDWGIGRPGGASMDYYGTGNECMAALAAETDVYLWGGTPLIIQKVDSAAGIFKLSSNLGAGGFGPSFAFKPAFGLAAPGSFVGPDNSDALNTGSFFNWDSTIVVEQTFYAPTTGAPNDNFVIMKTTYASNDGNDHANLMIGDLIDWDTPSDNIADNTAGIINKTVYLQGVDDITTTPECDLHSKRFSASTFLGMYTATEFGLNGCANNLGIHGTFASVNDATDSAAAGAPNGVIDSAIFWNMGRELTGQWVLTADTIDLRITQTFVHDYTLKAGDPLTVYTALVTIQNGTAATLDASVETAIDWYGANLRPGCNVRSCCEGTVGNVDGDAGVDIADLTFLIDFLFITFPQLICEEEANVDGDAGIDIADLTFLIDFLFITFPELPNCQ